MKLLLTIIASMMDGYEKFGNLQKVRWQVKLVKMPLTIIASTMDGYVKIRLTLGSKPVKRNKRSSNNELSTCLCPNLLLKRIGGAINRKVINYKQ
jgi:hypothetical protein